MQKTLSVLLLALVIAPAMSGRPSTKTARDYYGELRTIPEAFTQACFSESDDGSFFLIGIDRHAQDVIHLQNYFHGVPGEEWLLSKGKENGAPWSMDSLDSVDQSKGTIELYLNAEMSRYRMRITAHGKAPSDHGTCATIRLKKDSN